jgi:hypothetical protein
LYGETSPLVFPGLSNLGDHATVLALAMLISFVGGFVANFANEECQENKGKQI